MPIIYTHNKKNAQPNWSGLSNLTKRHSASQMRLALAWAKSILMTPLWSFNSADLTIILYTKVSEYERDKSKPIQATWGRVTEISCSVELIYWWDGRGLMLWLFVGPTGVYLLDFVCSGNQFNLLLSPYPCFISLLYLDLYVLGDDALIS